MAMMDPTRNDEYEFGKPYKRNQKEKDKEMGDVWRGEDSMMKVSEEDSHEQGRSARDEDEEGDGGKDA
ncbi:hypothetical protein HO133_005575 [Letharia lupina]|uniref:Uncharacterized protein n=1 Tax=Letharia lupina TaxID=560253 RepID=A0A8H6C991_9LECA|nr:uncharacterized protein HO133_005575 [Letharia lupina]KAF6219031.1 hypothetical protein HO133_005575 [Letharia lupina]